MSNATTTIRAGMAANNYTLFHRIRFLAPDASVIIDFEDGSSVYIVRDIEMERARSVVQADQICCPQDFIPEEGLSADRDTALAQATAECIRRQGYDSVQVDRSLPYIYAHYMHQAGIETNYAADLGVIDRRIKTEQEIEYLRHAQEITGQAVTFACQTVARAKAHSDGTLHHEGSVLTSERLRAMITAFLLEKNFSNHHDSIVACAPHAVGCHHFGSGPLRANIPVIIDIFPMDNATRYCGDMTRTVVWGEADEEVINMHKTVKAAKQAGCEALVAGTTGDAVHCATIDVLKAHGYTTFRGGERPPPDGSAGMTHGTGHGIGLEVHEPILLDHGGGEIFANEVFTVEPGLYSRVHGAVRIEDMVIATENGSEILAPIHEGLNWET